MRRKAARQIEAMPVKVQKSLALSLREIEESGPVRGKWPNYGKLEGTGQLHHCHLKRGRETMLVEVIYVGSHENAPY
jgi:hypothetical protein